MNKLNILQKVFEVIQESRTLSDETKSDNDCKVNNGSEADQQAIKELSIQFAKAINDRDFECLDGRAEYHLYTLNHLIELVKNSDEQKTVQLFSQNRIKSKYEDCEFISITFSEDQEQAVIVYDVKTCIISADEKYFKELNKNNKNSTIKSGTPFSTIYTLIVKKERGTWKVSNFEVTGNIKGQK